VNTSEIPLFPLRTVLVPGGYLSLQIFEPRYLDLVRECTRSSSGFGVCLILAGSESGQAPQHAAIGTLARIFDFNTLPNGLLGITTRGENRFRVLDTSIRDNGLLTAKVDWLPQPQPPIPLPEAYQVLAQVLDRFLEKVGSNYPGWQRELLEDADWVSFRLTELLPLSNLEKQALLEFDDAQPRLQRLLERLPDFQRPD
jgi:Lon protease-like protein